MYEVWSEVSTCVLLGCCFTDAGDVPLEQMLHNCIRQRDELLEIKKLSERQSVILKKLRETVTSGEFVKLCSDNFFN